MKTSLITIFIIISTMAVASAGSLSITSTDKKTGETKTIVEKVYEAKPESPAKDPSEPQTADQPSQETPASDLAVRKWRGPGGIIHQDETGNLHTPNGIFYPEGDSGKIWSSPAGRITLEGDTLRALDGVYYLTE